MTPSSREVPDVPDDLIARYERVLRLQCEAAEAVPPSPSSDGDDSTMGNLLARLTIVERELTQVIRALFRAGIVVERDPYASRLGS